MKYLSLFTVLFLACAAGDVPIHEYVLDVKASMLRGRTSSEDKPLSFCDVQTCYVYEDGDVRKIKKYISELELRLKDCKP